MILGLWNKKSTGPAEALALLRCVWRELWLALTDVDLKNEALIPEAVWLKALKRVRRAVIHRAVEIKRMHVKRVHTELVDCVSAEEAAKFSMYLDMGREGDYAISERLQSAIERAEADLAQAIGIPRSEEEREGGT